MAVGQSFICSGHFSEEDREIQLTALHGVYKLPNLIVIIANKQFLWHHHQQIDIISCNRREFTSYDRLYGVLME